MSDDHEVRGLNLVRPGAESNPRVARIREQLRANDAWNKNEPDAAEPPTVSAVRRRAEQLLAQRLYEDAEDTFLEAIEVGLRENHFCWQAALNIVNCRLFLRRLDEADRGAAGLLQMFETRPDHPVHYLAATQRGAIAAERWGMDHDPENAQAALGWAQRAYDWQRTYRAYADGLRAYNVIVALLRLDRRAEALETYRRHDGDDDFQTWCRQGEHAADIAQLTAE